MRAAQGGDGAAYAALLRDLTPLLQQRIQRQLRVLKPHDVEDLVQDVLLSLHVVRATYDPQRPFLPWLFGIVHNRIVDGARRYARHAAHEVAVEQWLVTISDEAANRDEEFGDPEALAQAYFESGRLQEVVSNWSPTFQGYHLYFPSRRNPSPAFAAFVEAFRYRSG